MYGWRGRIGIVVAAPNGVVENESFRMLPEGVSVHFARIPYAGTGTEEAEKKMLENLDVSSKLLAGSPETIQVNVIGFAHGSGTAFGGPGFDKMLNERITKTTGVRGIAMTTAVVDALNKLGAKKVSAASPFHQVRMLDGFVNLLQGYGFEVKARRNLDLNRHELVSGSPPSVAYNLMRSVDRDDIDAIVLNNPNIRTLDIIEQIEHDIGKPVVTGNQALIWACLRAIGVREPQQGLGKLFRI